MRLFLSVSILFLAFSVSDSRADEKGHLSLDALMAMDLEHLMEISIASKRKEKAWDAPGIITVISKEEIRQFGGNNLQDVLSRLPNFYLFSSSIFPDSVHSIRGQSPSGIDQHTLLLLNGRPMRESWIGAFNQPIYRNIPLESIDRIEVVRGPGSVLYGSNAFSGTINVVTRASQGSATNSITAGYGSFDTKITSGTAGVKGEDAELRVSAKSLHTDGWRFRAFDERGVGRGMDRGQDSYGFLVEGSYRKFKFTGFSGSVDENIMGLPPIWSSTQQKWDINRHFADVQYQHDFSRNWNASFNFTYNGTTGFTQGLGRQFNDFLFEPTVHGKILPNMNIVAGMTYQDLGGRLTTENVSYDNHWLNYYVQADYSPLKFLKLIGGLQLNKPEGIPYNLSPRAGLVLHSEGPWGAKVLYGQAFRSAYAVEQVSSGGRSIGNSRLNPEKIATFDAQVFYQKQKFYSAVTYYRSEQTNSIRLVTVPRGVQFVNQGFVDYQGVELEGRGRVLPRLELSGSVSVQENVDNLGNREVGRVPRIMVKTGVSYNSPKGYTLSLFNSYYSSPERLAGAPQLNPQPDDHNWMTFKGSVNLRKITNDFTLPDLTFSLYGENLTDADIFLPEVGRARINSFPHRSGVGVYGYVTLGF